MQSYVISSKHLLGTNMTMLIVRSSRLYLSLIVYLCVSTKNKTKAMGIILNIGLGTNSTNHVLPYTSCMLQIPSETLFSNASSTHDIHEVAPAYLERSCVITMVALCVRARYARRAADVRWVAESDVDSSVFQYQSQVCINKLKGKRTHQE